MIKLNNHVLVGNGINIQFGGNEYSNKSIIDRAINNIDSGNFPEEVYPKETKLYFEQLYKLSSKVFKGKLNHLADSDIEKKELSEFISRYRFHKGKLRYYQIGFEDYFFLHHLFCNYHKINNPNKFYYQQQLRCFFIDSIFNSGKINSLYELYPDSLKSWFSQFSEVFTTNYDKNIELLTGIKVSYLHGAFHIISDIYDKDGFRNKLSDRPIDNYVIIEGYDHLYSTALTTYSGSLKEFSGTMNPSANKLIEKFVEEIDRNPKKLEEISRFKNEPPPQCYLYEAIILKLKDRTLKFEEGYPFEKLKTCSGTLTIIGLSPNNDSHLIDMINNNEGITKIIYYYFEEKEGQSIVQFFSNKEVELRDVTDFWNSIE